MKVHSLGVLSFITLGLALNPGTAQERLLVRAGRIHLSNQQILNRGSLLIEKGRIQDVAERSGKPGDLPFDSMTTNKLVYKGAVVTPAFIDIHSLPPDLVRAGELRERNFAMTPAWDARKAYDPFAPRWKALLRRGVTTIALAPDDGNLAGGSAAWIRPGPSALSPEGEAYLKLSLSASVLNRERKPTSLLGAVDILRNTFVEAKNPLKLVPTPSSASSPPPSAADESSGSLARPSLRSKGLSTSFKKAISRASSSTRTKPRSPSLASRSWRSESSLTHSPPRAPRKLFASPSSSPRPKSPSPSVVRASTEQVSRALASPSGLRSARD